MNKNYPKVISIGGPPNISKEIIERIATSIYNRKLDLDRLIEVEIVVLREIYKLQPNNQDREKKRINRKNERSKKQTNP